MIPVSIDSYVAQFEEHDAKTGRFGALAQIRSAGQMLRELDPGNVVARRFIRWLDETIASFGVMKEEILVAEGESAVPGGGAAPVIGGTTPAEGTVPVEGGGDGAPDTDG
jgi:hypothetical protein